MDVAPQTSMAAFLMVGALMNLIFIADAFLRGRTGRPGSGTLDHRGPSLSMAAGAGWPHPSRQAWAGWPYCRLEAGHDGPGRACIQAGGRPI